MYGLSVARIMRITSKEYLCCRLSLSSDAFMTLGNLRLYQSTHLARALIARDVAVAISCGTTRIDVSRETR